MRYWQAWIEPTSASSSSPSFGEEPRLARIYGRMVNAFAAGVHVASPQNLVIAGGAASFRRITPSVLAICRSSEPTAACETFSSTARLFALDTDGRPDFDRLGERMLHRRNGEIRNGIAGHVFVFDVLTAEGVSTTKQH